MVKLWWSFYFSINLKYNSRMEELARITEVDLELKPPSDKPNNRKKWMSGRLNKRSLNGKRMLE